MQSKRLYSLDFLKFIASLLIVLHNYQGYSLENCGIPDIDVLKYLVEFFFLLSGFFAFDYIEKIMRGTVNLKQFFSRKAKRLLPLLFVSIIGYNIAISLYYTYIKPKNFKIDFWNSVLTSLGISNGWIFPDNDVYINGPTWYIAVLLLCLVIFYILTYIAKRLKITPFYFYCAVVLIGLAFVENDLDKVFLFERSCRGYYSFFFGVILGYLIKNRKPTKLLYILSTISIVGSSLLYIFNYTKGNTVYFLTFFTFAPLIILFTSDPIVKLFDHSIFGTLGGISFDIYVWQQPVFYTFWSILVMTGSDFDYKSVKGMIIGFILAVAFGIISYFLIEKPLNKLVDKYSGRNLLATPRGEVAEAKPVKTEKSKRRYK